MNGKDLSGQRFGKLLVLQRAEKPPQCRKDSAYWLCRCDCGNERIVLGTNLTSGHTTSCGCKKLRDLTGQHIGKLTVIGRSDRFMTRGKRKVRLWECVCECGNITYKATDTLTSDAENSCAECAAKHNAACARKNAGFVDGTQLAKITDLKPSAANTSGCRVYPLTEEKDCGKRLSSFGAKSTDSDILRNLKTLLPLESKRRILFSENFLNSIKACKASNAKNQLKYCTV